MMGEDPAAQPEAKAPSAYSKLSTRLKRFVEAYVETGVGTEAMRRIGFTGKWPDVAASKLRRRANVRAAIEELDALAAENAGITRTMVLMQLRHVATFDHRRLYGPDGNPLPIHQLPADVAAGLAQTEVEELFEGKGDRRQHVGRIHKFRSWSKTDALRLLAQAKRMLPNQHEHAGAGGAQLPAGPVFVVSQEEAAQIDRDLDQRV